MSPDHTPWVPSLLGAILLAMAAFTPGVLAQNDTTDPPSGGNETEPMPTAGGGAADRLSYADGHADGRFVSFDLDPATGTVCDWTFKGRLVLDEISWGEGGFSADVRQAGASVVVTDMGAGGGSSAGSSGSGNSGSGNSGGGGGGDSGSPYQSMENGTGNGTDDTPDNGTGNQTGNGTAPPSPPPGGEGNGTVTTTGACADQTVAGNGTPTGDDGRGRGAGGSSRMVLHDNPIGSIKAEMRGDQQLSIVVADEFEVSLDGGRVTVQGTGFEARLWKDHDSKEGGLAVDGQTISMDSAKKANLMWRVVDAGNPGDSEIADAQEQGRVACEVLVLPDGDVVSESGEDGDVVVETSRSETTIDITIDITQTTNVVMPPAQPDSTPTSPPQPDDGTQGNDTGNGTDDGNTTVEGNATAEDGNATASGNGTTTPPDGDTTQAVAVVVIDLDATVVAGATADAITVLIDGTQVQAAASVDDVLAAVPEVDAEADADTDGTATASAEATAFVGELPDGGLRVVSTASAGSQVLSLQSAAPVFEAESVPIFGDSSDDAQLDTTSGGDGASEAGDDDAAKDDDGTDISVPGPALPAVVLAMLAAAAFAIRRRK